MTDKPNPVRVLVEACAVLATADLGTISERIRAADFAAWEVADLLDAGKLAVKVECVVCVDGYLDVPCEKQCLNCHGTGEVWEAIK